MLPRGENHVTARFSHRTELARKAATSMSTRFRVLAIAVIILALPFFGRGKGTADDEKQANDKKVRTDRHGDPLPPGATARLGTIRLRHGGYVSHVAFSPDGKALVSVGGDYTIRLWDPKTGKEIRRLGGKDVFYTQSFAFSPDGKMLAAYTYGQQGSVLVLEYPSGNVLLKIRGVGNPGGGNSFAFSADSKVFLIVQNGDMVHRWEIATGDKLKPLTGARLQLTTMTVSPDGKMVAAGGGGQIFLWDGPTGKLLRQWEDFCGARSLAFLSGSKFLAGNSLSVSGHLWDTGTGKEVRLLGTGYAIAPAPDGKTLAMACGNHIRRWDLTTNKELRRLRAYRVNSMCYSPDGTMLATAYYGRIRLMDAVDGKELLSGKGSDTPFTCVAFSPDGKTAATGGMGSDLRLWDRSGKVLRVLENEGYAIQAVAFAPGGKIVAAASGEMIRLWNVATGKLTREIKTNVQSVTALAFAPDGKTLAFSGWGTYGKGLVGSPPASVQIWDVTGKEIKRFKGNGGGNSLFQTLSFSSDGKILAWGDDRVHLTEVATGEDLFCWTIARQSNIHLRFVAFGPDDATVIAADENTVQIREAKTGKDLGRLPLAADGQVMACALSADGRTLAMAVGRRIELGGVTLHDALPQVVLWELSTGKVRRRLSGHDGRIAALAFAPDGALVSASQDSTALIWEGPAPARQTGDDLLSPQEVEKRWAMLADPDAGRAYDAVCDLVRSPRAAVSWLQKILRPVRPADPQRVRLLLRDLDSSDFSVRQAAARQLEAFAEGAEPMLRDALQTQLTLETRRRVLQALEKLDPLQSAERLREMRAVEVLEWIGSADAKSLLKTLATGLPSARMTREARASLQRLKRHEPERREQ